MKNKHLKKLVRKIHLYLGLSTGLVVLIVSLTGAIWVFNEEITSLNSSQEFNIIKQNKKLITASEAKKIGLKIFPNHPIHGVEFSSIETEPIEVIFHQKEPQFYQSIYLNPYNGKLLKVENHLTGFFHFILQGHRFLWLPHQLGSQIVAWSTFIFLFMLISGIVLWWPKNRSARKQRLKFKWKPTTKWKRKNFDLHAILGFYSSIFIFFIILTGTIMAFNWMAFIVYKGIGGNKENFFLIPNNKTEVLTSNLTDELIPKLKVAYKDAKSFEFHYPKDDSLSVYVEISYDDQIHYNNDYRFYDQQTLEEIEVNALYGAYENTDASDKFSRMTYDIHIGTIFSLPGKILAFLLSLLSASLPVTGFMIWRGRVNKKKKD